MSEIPVSNTFTVSDVTVASEPLAELPYHEAVGNYLCGQVESCSRYHGKLVANVVSHPLIAALHAAFTTHRPICLSPDIVWLTITQGLAIHINLHAESLRSQFVSHGGKLTIEVRRDDFIKGTPENPWPEVFSAFSDRIRDHIGDWYDRIVADFSTTGAVERAASELALLDSMQSYFDYEFHSKCGIPAITLQGTVADWESVAARTETFSEAGLEWWVNALRPVLSHFVDAAAGHVDQSFWNSIYKYQGSKGSGSPYISGWINTFFPYLRDWDGNPERNKWIDAPSSRNCPSRESFPNTTSKVPFKWEIGVPPETTSYEMEFIGGLIGVSQCPDTFTLRPEIGWAVREAGKPTPAQEQHEGRWLWTDLDRYSTL